ncbi:MAG: YesL family protein [Acetatifactor sp.]
MKLFDLDSPLMQGLSKMADLMWLNILTILCCLPIVTVGPALTALNYMALKIVRNEECYITKGYFTSFKRNFIQGTIIWLIFLVIIAVLGCDFYIMSQKGDQVGTVTYILVMASSIFVLFALMFVFPILAKFDNSIFRTIKNALLVSAVQFPKTIAMIVMYVIPVLLFIYIPQIIPLVLMFGLAIPAWLSAKMYNRFFQKLEDQIMENNKPADGEAAEEDEHIFSDEQIIQ